VSTTTTDPGRAWRPWYIKGEETGMAQGTVKWFNSEKGFGCIAAEASRWKVRESFQQSEKNQNESWIEMIIFAAVLVVSLMPASTPKQEALRIAIRVVEHASHSISHSIAGRAMTEDERRELSGRFSRSWKQFGNLPFRRSDEESRGTYVWEEPDARPS
jgi:hypothetical protein